MKALFASSHKYPADLFLFSAALAGVGFAQGLVDATFNNFLKETFQLTNLSRAILELPRELPGLLTVFVTAFLFLLGARRTAAVANLLAAVGILLIGFCSFSFPIMLVWLFVFSLGQHIFLPLNSSLGLDLATHHAQGQRLGLFAGIQNLATIMGSLVIFIGFSLLHFNFQISYLIAAIFFFTASLFLFLMKPDKAVPPHLRLKLNKKYSLYYWLAILYGTRKQIFLTFAPWVLVNIYHQPTTVLAGLLFASGLAGVFFKPLLGHLIDRLGERLVLAAEALLLIFICLSYGFAETLFPFTVALPLICASYLADYLLMSVSMARATYLHKIITDPAELAPTLSMASSIDHLFSIIIALSSGVIWSLIGYQAVFILAAVLSTINLFSALRIKIPLAQVLNPSPK